MKFFKQLIVGAVLAASFGTSAYASVVQSIAPTSASSRGGWAWVTLGGVVLADGTNSVSALTSVATVVDQGWGGQDPNANQVLVSLFENGTNLWNAHVAGAAHAVSTQAYDITNDRAALAGLNEKLAAIDWSSHPTVMMQMVLAPLGYGGWQLFASNASFSVTSSASSGVTSGVVPEPASLALLGLGLTGLAFSRKKFSK